MLLAAPPARGDRRCGCWDWPGLSMALWHWRSDLIGAQGGSYTGAALAGYCSAASKRPQQSPVEGMGTHARAHTYRWHDQAVHLQCQQDVKQTARRAEGWGGTGAPGRPASGAAAGGQQGFVRTAQIAAAQKGYKQSKQGCSDE